MTSNQQETGWHVPLKLPLVSIIVSNYNYGRYLRDAVESALAQTYPCCECIVIDDCSNDNSAEILEVLRHERPNVSIISLNENLGQSGALLQGLKVANGNYVLMLDADDLLLPECVAHHVALHFSTRRPVGFSSCNAIQIVDNNIVTSHAYPFGILFPSFPQNADLLRSIEDINILQERFKFPVILASDVRHVPSKLIGLWPWATMSCMFFRRDALDLICAASELQVLRICTDNYLALAINMLTGSIIIDKSLVCYRFHGSNNFARRAPLDNLINFNWSEEPSKTTYRIFLNDLLARFDVYYACFFSTDPIVAIAEVIDTDPSYGEHCLPSLIEAHREIIEHQVGGDFVKDWLKRLEAKRDGGVTSVETEEIVVQAASHRLAAGFPASGIQIPKLAWRFELEVAKFLCTVGLTRYGAPLWRHAVRRINADRNVEP